MALRKRRPNILLFLADQHRPDWLGSSPAIPVRTPNLQAVADRGVTFTKAVCPSPLCAPSRACFAAGMEYDRCGVPDNSVDYPPDQTTHYRLLRDEAGYRVAGVGKFDLHKGSPSWGIRGKHLLSEWGFSEGIDNAGKFDAVRSGAETPKDPYMAYLHERGLAKSHVDDINSRTSFAITHPTPLPDEAYCDNWLAQNGLDLLDSFPQDAPWYLIVNFTGPHNPMDITESMATLYEGVDFPQPLPSKDGHKGSRAFDPETHNRIRRNYSAMVENIDRLVGRYIEVLRARGELENTLIVYTSDHGEMLGDLGRWGKTEPYQPSIGIPMIVAGPGVTHRRAYSSPTSLIDLTATFVEYAGLRIPETMDGISLCRVLEGSNRAHRTHVLSGLGSWRLVYDGRYKLIEGYDPEKKTKSKSHVKGAGHILVDQEHDPAEQHNLAAERPDILDSLVSLM